MSIDRKRFPKYWRNYAREARRSANARIGETRIAGRILVLSPWAAATALATIKTTTVTATIAAVETARRVIASRQLAR